MPSQFLISDLVEQAIKEAPPQNVASELPMASIYKVAEALEAMAAEMESEESGSLTAYKSKQSDKLASMREIIDTYMELQS